MEGRILVRIVVVLVAALAVVAYVAHFVGRAT